MTKNVLLLALLDQAEERNIDNSVYSAFLGKDVKHLYCCSGLTLSLNI